MTLPDPNQIACREAAHLANNREQYLEFPVQRVLSDSPFADRHALLDGITTFHRERMARTPDPIRYPESAPWVEVVRETDRRLQELTGISDTDLAIFRSLHAYVQFRGMQAAATLRQPAMTEKCRVAYIPDSDHGALHIKNLDDPREHWKPEGEPTWLYPRDDRNLFSDGVGNGLHMDDEPDDIFPLPVRVMYREFTDDVPGAVEFLTRYASFWGSANILLYDRSQRVVAIEKCSHNFIEVFEPAANGCGHISGMTCRDPASPQGRYQTAQRDKYLKLFGRDDQCADALFWNMCRQFENKLAAALANLPRPAPMNELVELFTRAWPEGLRKTGQRLHPDQGLIGYTLITLFLLQAERRLLRWQRSALPDFIYPDTPEEFRF